MDEFFSSVPEPVAFAGSGTDSSLAYQVYDPDRLVGGKRMEDHLRIAVCYWHSFNWPGNDVFGDGTFDRPWLAPTDDPIQAAFDKQDAAFEFFTKLGTPYYCFHDVDMAPSGANLSESEKNLEILVERAAEKQEATGVKLLWGTANVFSHPRFAAGAATNPDPEVFAYAATQVRNALRATHRLGGANYVLWGGREGYETLLNTDMGRENDQLARFLHLVADYKRSIGFTGKLLLEPKPQEHETPVRLRLRDGPRLLGPLRPSGRIPRQHRGQSRHPRRAQLSPRGRVRPRQRHPRQRRCEPRRPAERLGHRPVPELGR